MEPLQTDLTLKAEITLYYDLYVPEKLQTPAPLLVAVHGYGAHKRYMMREARAVASDQFVIAAVQGPHQHFRPTDGGYRVGFGWLTDHRPEEYVRLHHDLLLRVVDKLTGEGLVDPSHVYLYGFSQACALNFRFAFTYPDVLKGLIGVCGGIPGDLEGNPHYWPFSAETLYLYGDEDEFYSQEKFAEFERKLAAILPNFRSEKYRAGHEITDEMRRDIAEFLSAGAALSGHGERVTGA